MPSTLIDNQWLQGGDAILRSLRPDTTQCLWEKTASSVEQVEAAVLAAKAAFTSWRGLAQSERSRIAEKYANVLLERQTVLAQAISDETGKPRWEALAEVAAMANKVAISLRAQAQRSGSHEKTSGAQTKIQLRLKHRPHGVMAVFGPYNFPGHLPNGHIVPALLAGNCVVFKPSELTPLVAELTAQAWLDAGLPPGVLNLVQGGRKVGEALAKADINGLLFTGSSATGNLLHKHLAGRPEVLLALEMGGNNPMIVGQVDNLDVCANIIIHSAFLSAGQRCTCTRRLILLKNTQHQTLVEKVIAQAQRIIVNTPQIDQQACSPFMGPLINRQAAQQFENTLASLTEQGASVLLNTRSLDSSGVYMTPAIVDVSGIANPVDEEIFAPLLQITYADNFTHALELANATRYGLAAGLLSDNAQEQEDFSNNINAGVISINSPTAGASSELPFGGVGASGNHRPSAFYAADYCAWPQAASVGEASCDQARALQLDAIRGLR